MSTVDGWKHRWYGVWKEYGPAYRKCPSIRGFLRSDLVARYDRAGLRKYLTTASVIATTSRTSFPDPITGAIEGGSISYRTDGKWLWLDNLADLIDHYDVAIPPGWLREIERRNFTPPSLEEPEKVQLEWPPIVEANG